MDSDSDPGPRVVVARDDDVFGELYRRHHPAVLRVTQALLRQDDAQDATQEAFLKAMESTPGVRREGSVRSWLLRIAARVAIDRGRTRRRRREQSVVEVEGLAGGFGDPSAAVETREWERLLLRALLDLAPEFREPLVLRYWDGCALSEIASRLGIPRSTADKRCHEGLSLLRERLGSRGRKSLPLFLGTVPGVAAAMQGATPTVPSLLTSGVALMTGKSLATCSVAALLLAGLTLSFLLREDAPVGKPGEASVTDATTGALSSPASAAVQTTGGAEAGAPIVTHAYVDPAAASTAAGGWQVRGQVLLGGTPAPAGTPVQARLHAGWWDEGWSAGGDPELETTLETGEDGVFRWTLEPPMRAVTFAVRAEVGGFTPATERRYVRGDASPPQDLQVALSPLDITVAGVVRERDGLPVPHPRIRCGSLEVLGDKEGAYRIRANSSRPQLYVGAWAEGFSRTERIVTPPEPGGQAEVDFVLDAGVTVSGRIVDTEGRPVAGARVYTWDGQPEEQVVGGDGTYRVAGLRRGQQSSFGVEAEGFAEKRVWLKDLVEDVAGRDVVVSRGGTLRGTVVEEAGSPVEGARIVVGGGFGHSGALKTVSDRDGSFEVKDAPPGRTGIHVVCPGYVQLEVAVEVEAGGFSGGLRLVLRRGQALHGRVVDESGAPIAEAHIAHKDVEGNYVVGKYLEGRAHTNEDGTFKLEDVAGPEVGVEVWGRGLVRLRTRVRIGPEPAVLVVKRHGVIAGRILDADTGEPLTRFRIRLLRPEAQPGDRAASGYSGDLASLGRWFASADGTFAIDDEAFPPGTVIGVEAGCEGYAPARAPRVVCAASPEPDHDAVVLRLHRAAVLEGRVLDAEAGTPVSGARVRWRRVATPVGPWDAWHYGEEADTRVTTGDGNFAFEDVPAEPVRLEVDASGYPLFHEGPIVIPSAGTRIVRNVFLPRGATIEGVVEETVGVPVPGVAVDLRLDTSGGLTRRFHDTHADAKGRFRFTGLAPGQWILSRSQRVGRYGITLYEVPVEVTGAETHRVRLAPPDGVRVVVTVKSAEPLPDDAMIEAVSLSDGSDGKRPSQQAAFVTGGRAVFQALPTGRWRLEFRSLPGFRSFEGGSLDADLDPGGERTFELFLRP